MFENILLLIIFACKVEEDLEAMFAGIGSPEDNKPKESDQSSSLSPAPSQPELMSQGSNHIPQASTDKAISQPMLEPEVKSARSKRKSAQTAELKIRENQSEDYSMYQPRFKAPRESPKATRLPKESAKLKESPKPSSSQAPKLKESPKSASSKGSKLEKSPKPKLQDSPKPLNSNVPKLEEKSKPSSSKPPRLEESPKTSSSSGDSSKKSKTSSKNEPEETMKAAREINDAAENAKETIKIDKDAKSTEDVETPKPSPRQRNLNFRIAHIFPFSLKVKYPPVLFMYSLPFSPQPYLQYFRAFLTIYIFKEDTNNAT